MSTACLLCHSPNTRCLEEIPTASLVQLYQKQLHLDIRGEFKGRAAVNLYHCLDCDLRFFFPPHPGSDGFYEQLQNFDWYYLEDKNEYTFASQKIRPADRVLDVGCGRGALARKIPTSHFTGLEFNAKAINEATRNGVRVLSQTIEEHAKSNTGAYDVVCAFQVLEHIADTQGFVSACVAALRPGGLLIFSVPSHDSFARYVPNFILDMPPHHMTRWSDAALQSIARTFALEVVEIWHEPLQAAHLGFYSETLIRNALFRGFRRPTRNIDSRLSTKITSRVAQFLGTLLSKGLSDAALLPRGISVTTVYRKP